MGPRYRVPAQSSSGTHQPSDSDPATTLSVMTLRMAELWKAQSIDSIDGLRLLSCIPPIKFPVNSLPSASRTSTVRPCESKITQSFTRTAVAFSRRRAVVLEGWIETPSRVMVPTGPAVPSQSSGSYFSTYTAASPPLYRPPCRISAFLIVPWPLNHPISGQWDWLKNTVQPQPCGEASSPSITTFLDSSPTSPRTVTSVPPMV